MQWTIDEIYGEQLSRGTPDPVVAQFVVQLQAHAIELNRAIDDCRWRAADECAIRLCRTTQQIRLEVGELHTLESVSRSKIAEILASVVKQAGSPDTFAGRLSEEGREYGRYAAGSIFRRHAELSCSTDAPRRLTVGGSLDSVETHG